MTQQKSPKQLILLSQVRNALETIIDPVPSATTIVSWIESGNLDGSKIKGRWYLRRGSLQKLIDSLTDSLPGETIL